MVGRNIWPSWKPIAPRAAARSKVGPLFVRPRSMQAVEAAGLHNVTLVEGREQETNFPSSSCDALFMRDVYHHFVNPPTMNASILRSLKPGGRLAIIDFTPPPGGENPAGSRAIDNHHGITPPTLENELKAAGFEAVTASEPSPRNFLVVGRHPS